MQRKAVYSFTWANKQADLLREKYTRATDLILRLYGLSMREFAAFLAFNDPVWPFLRSRIHWWDNNLQYRVPKYSTDVTLFEVEKNWVNRFADPERLKGRLTAIENRLMIGEQGKRGEGEEGPQGTKGPSEPSLPTRDYFQVGLFQEYPIHERVQ